VVAPICDARLVDFDGHLDLNPHCSGLDALLADACVLLSLLLQHGVEPDQIASSMGRSGNIEAASIIGAVIDLAAKAAPADENTEADS
jgi:hypothetical protein